MRKLTLSLIPALGLALALPLAATAQPQTPAPASSAPGGAFELVREQEVQTATIVDIDKQSRFVTLREGKGTKREFTIEAGPEVRNFDQLKVGDQVIATYQAAAALELLPAGSASTGVVTSTDAARAPKGDLPGGAAQQAISITSKLTAIDLKKHTVTLQGPDGKQRVVEVKDPARQARMTRLRVGDLVRITYVEALAVDVVPKPH
jgi:Spy/CpxP family protein refolding chaperone